MFIHDFLPEWRGLEAILWRGWSRVLDADGRGLEGEGFRLGEGVVFLCELGVFVVIAHAHVVVGVAVFGEGMGVLVGVWGFIAFEARGVGRGLGAELGEVEVCAGFVAQVHGFVESAFGVESVEYDAVDGDCDDFDDDFDQGADEGPTLHGLSVTCYEGVGEDYGTYLESADEGVVYVFIVELFPLAFFT